MKVINIEGIDAVGKWTVSTALEKRLSNKGFRVKRVSFPNYESHIGKAINDVLMGSCGSAPDLDGTLMGSLYSIDRLAYFTKNMKELFDTCDYLICDRSFYSNFMYQASKIYINNSSYYERDTIPAKLEDWIIRNNKIEIIDTGLMHCEDIQTFVLSLSEEDSLKQLGNRKKKDTNELNRKYLNECKKFIAHWMDDKNKEIIQNSKGKSTLAKSAAFANYIFNVHNIEVIHADDPKDIEYATEKNVDKIMSYLFADFTPSTKPTNVKNTLCEETFNTSIDYSKYFNDFSKINCILQSFYISIKEGKWKSRYSIDVNRVEFTFDFNKTQPFKAKVIINESIYDNIPYYEYIKKVFAKDINGKVEEFAALDWNNFINNKFSTPLRFIYDGKDFKVEQVEEKKNEN